MSQELAAKNNIRVLDNEYFAGFRPLLEAVENSEGYFDKSLLLKRFDELEEKFPDDVCRAGDIADLLFGDDMEAFGPRVTEVFAAWEKEGGGPALTGMIAQAIEFFRLDPEQPCVKAAFISAILAEYPNHLQYHGNEHYRKVLLHAIRLITEHNRIFKDTNRALNATQIAELLTASCVHDLGHEGGDNLQEGMYTPGQMEQYAFVLSKPYFERLGVPEDQMGDIETIVFCTDITFFAGDNSPCIRMKKIYKHYFWDDDRDDVSMMMMGKLRRYEDNPRLVLMAMLLHEADVATSAGVSYEQTVKETINIMEERGVTTAGPRTVLAFLREQLGETMFTEASKQLYGPVMAEVIRRAEEDIARGRVTYYEE